MKSRSFAVIGLLLLVCGGVAIAGSTFGFSTAAADRGLSATIADDQANAYLGVESEGDIGTLRGDDEPRVAGALTNNFDEDVEVLDVQIYNDDGVLAVESPNPGATVSPGETDDVTVACAESTGLGERTVTVEFVEVAGATVSAERVSFDVTVDVQCNKGSGSGVVGFQANDVSTANASQTFSFDGSGLKNGDETYVDLSEPQNGGVDYTNGSVTVVSGKGSASYDANADRITYTASGNEKGNVELRIDGVAVSGDAGGERYKVTYAESRKNSENRDDSDIFYVTG